MSERRPKPPVPVPVEADDRGRYRVHPEWIGQATLINVGLIVLAIYLVSTLIGVGTPDIASKIALVSLVISMPLLAILAMLLQLQESRRWASYPWYLTTAQALAQGTCVLGFGAALWHVWWPSSIALIASGVVGLLVYQAYYRRLEKDNRPEHERRKRS